MKKCYIAGKISGLTYEEFTTNFAKAREEVKALGMIPICPVEINTPAEEDCGNKTWLEYMKSDLTLLLRCDCIYAQTNYLASKGAKIEVYLCRDLDIEIIYQKI